MFQTLCAGIARPLYSVRSKTLHLYRPDVILTNKKSGVFSKTEVQTFDKLYAIHGNDWVAIGKAMCRSRVSVQGHFKGTVPSTATGGPWSEHEDGALTEAVAACTIFGSSDVIRNKGTSWKKVENMLKAKKILRTAHQCRRRNQRLLDQIAKKSIKFRCNHCDAVYEREGNLVKHLAKKHGADPTKEKEKVKRKRVRARTAAHRTSGKFECNHCDVVYNRKDNLVTHLLKKHGVAPAHPEKRQHRPGSRGEDSNTSDEESDEQDLEEEEEEDSDEESQLYTTVEDETPWQIAKRFENLDAKVIVALNKQRLLGLHQHSKMMDSTVILIPSDAKWTKKKKKKNKNKNKNKKKGKKGKKGKMKKEGEAKMEHTKMKVATYVD